MNTCHFSDDRTHRFTLTHVIDANNPRTVQFIGLNPSSADETRLDPTLTRCVGFARKWGYGVFVMTNLFSLVSTDPKGLLASDEPNRRINDTWIGGTARNADLIVCAWGVHGAYRGRGELIASSLSRYRELFCLGKTKAGHPRHPLYIAADTPIEVYRYRNQGISRATP